MSRQIEYNRYARTAHGLAFRRYFTGLTPSHKSLSPQCEPANGLIIPQFMSLLASCISFVPQVLVPEFLLTLFFWFLFLHHRRTTTGRQTRHRQILKQPGWLSVFRRVSVTLHRIDDHLDHRQDHQQSKSTIQP